MARKSNWSIKDEMKEIKGHISTINEELGNIKVVLGGFSEENPLERVLTKIITDQKWIKWLVGISLTLAAASLGIKLVFF